MEKKQAIVIGVAAIAALGLFSVVYMQLSGSGKPAPAAAPVRTASTPEAGKEQGQLVMPTPAPMSGIVEQPVAQAAIPTDVPVAQPQTASDVAANIAAQMDNEGKALDVESQATASQAQSDSSTLNSVGTSYDQTQN